MAKRKYAWYEVATDFGEHTTDDYREALSIFRRSESATIYGIDEIGNYSVILSK